MLVPVLMYHDIREDNFRLPGATLENAPYILPRSEFQRQIDFIASSGLTAGKVRDLGRIALGTDRPDERERAGQIILSFDDGDVSNYERAFKLILRHGLEATFFVVTDFVGRQGYVSWQQLREMQAAGMEIGSHSLSHPVPLLLDDLQLGRELSESKEILEDKLGSEIESFSLPRGFGHPNLGPLARKAGYRAVCNSRPGYVNTRAFSPFAINRIAIRRTTSFDEFLSYVRCSGYVMKKMIVKEKLMNGVKALLGVEAYDRIRRSVLGRIYG